MRIRVEMPACRQHVMDRPIFLGVQRVDGVLRLLGTGAFGEEQAGEKRGTQQQADSTHRGLRKRIGRIIASGRCFSNSYQSARSLAGERDPLRSYCLFEST